MRVLIACTFCVILVFTTGCTDKTVNNYYSNSTGAIMGTVSPPDAGTVRAVGEKTYEAAIALDGSFHLDNLPAGTYQVIIQPVHFSRREFHDRIVASGSTVILARVALSHYPYPIYKVEPADGSVDIYPTSVIRIYADEPLNMDDLLRYGNIDPPVIGQWHEAFNYDSFSEYEFISPRGDEESYGKLFQYGHTYHVTIDGSVRTLRGTPLGADLSSSFTTKPLTVAISIPISSISGGTSIWDMRPKLTFPECVDVDSLTLAAAFEPPIPGVWLGSVVDFLIRGGCGGPLLYRQFQFFPSHYPLPVKTSYRLIISDKTKLFDDVHLSKPDTTFFTTEGYSVTYVYPGYGYYSVTTDKHIKLTFNASMDSASVEAAFSLTDVGGAEVEGAFVWVDDYRNLTVTHDQGPLKNQTLYRISVSKEAMTATGFPLERDFKSYFVTE